MEHPNQVAGPAPAILVLGVIGAYVHVVAYWVLQHALKNSVFHVAAPRTTVSRQEFIEADIETGAKAILVSSLSGHAEIECDGLKDGCQEAEVQDLPPLILVELS